MKGIDPGKPHPYIPKCDRELKPEEQTVFSVVFISAAELSKMRDDMWEETGAGKKREVKFRTGTFELQTLIKGLKGWKGLFHPDTGAEIPYDKDRPKEMIDFIPPDIRSELASHIQGQKEED